jgi:hypothetical protein
MLVVYPRVMPDIRLQLARSGGFGGLSLPVIVLDTSGRTRQYGEELARLVEEAERAPLRKAGTGNVPDAMRYELTLSTGGAVRRLSFNDASATPELRRLMKRIQSDGRPR